MKIEFDTDAMTVTAEGVDPIEVENVDEAMQVIMAAAGELESGEIEPDETNEEEAEEQSMMESFE